MSLEDFCLRVPYPVLLPVTEAPRSADPEVLALEFSASATRKLLVDRSALRAMAQAESSRAPVGLRKTQTAFPTMITVGRTANNDIHLEDPSVSRFHAFFEVKQGVVELGDAGSSEGTRVAGQRLEPKGALVVVAPGTTVAFGNSEFILLSPDMYWHRLNPRK